MHNRRHDRAGQRDVVGTHVGRQLGGVRVPVSEKPVSQAQDKPDVKNEPSTPERRRLPFVPSQNASYDDQDENDGERNEGKIGPEKQSE